MIKDQIENFIKDSENRFTNNRWIDYQSEKFGIELGATIEDNENWETVKAELLKKCIKSVKEMFEGKE